MSSREMVQRNLQAIFKKRGVEPALTMLAVFTDDWDVDELTDFAKNLPNGVREVVLLEIKRRKAKESVLA
jgi:intracellular sulfur oxidation DsrE/DsrF family protein